MPDFPPSDTESEDENEVEVEKDIIVPEKSTEDTINQ